MGVVIATKIRRDRRVANSAERYDDDASAVRRVLAGDTDAFEGIVRRWQGPLVNLAYRFCRDRAVAEEMTQEAFLKIFRGLSSWRQDGRFSTWMFSVALNHCRSTMRQRKAQTVELDEINYRLAAGDHGLEQDRDLRDDAVRRAVATLPPKYRDVIVLYYFHEMDLAETAQTSRLREGTVKARLFRGRKLLQQKLASLIAAPTPTPEEA